MQNKLVDIDGDQGKLGIGKSKKRNTNMIVVDPVEPAKSSASSKRSKDKEEEVVVPEIKVFDKDMVVGASTDHRQEK